MLTRTEKEEEEDDDDEKEGGEGPGGARAKKTRYGEGEQNACDARKGSAVEDSIICSRTLLCDIKCIIKTNNKNIYLSLGKV